MDVSARQTDPPTAAGSYLRGRILETTIERIVPGGYGLAHAEGRTLFVELAAPGDRVRARVERVRGALGYAAIVEVLEPSPERVAPPHPSFARCGGADFQHLAYDAQLTAKVEIVRDCLRRIAGIDPPGDLPITPSPRQWRYRSRAEWRHDPAGPALGYVEHGTHRVCDVAHDPMVVPELDAVLSDLRRRLDAGVLPPEVAEVRVAAGDDGVSIAPPIEGSEPATVTHTVAGVRYASDAECFFQVNHGVLESLVAEALRFVPAPAVGSAHSGDRQGSDRLAIDLYCGVGLFTLPLARRFGRVIGVEAHDRSAGYALRNATDAALTNVRIEAMPVERWLARAYRSHGRAAFVLLDPPRTGLPMPALHGLLRLRPRRITYVSCDPATLARDLRALVTGGYGLDGAAAFDMFPQTHHVEVVAHLVPTG